MRRASFEVSTCIVRCECVRRSTHVLTSFGVRANALNFLPFNTQVLVLYLIDY